MQNLQGDPGAIFAYCSSGCSKVSVLPSDSEKGSGLERVVVYNTYAISFPSQGGTNQLHPNPIRPLGNVFQYWFATNLVPNMEDGPCLKPTLL